MQPQVPAVQHGNVLYRGFLALGYMTLTVILSSFPRIAVPRSDQLRYRLRLAGKQANRKGSVRFQGGRNQKNILL